MTYEKLAGEDDLFARFEQYTLLLATGSATINEVRGLEGLPPLPDEVFTPAPDQPIIR